tara:strand:+ start:93 stop:407 length:315 start_codon:yes stop_codon:yes gene_type:complete
MPIYTFQNTKTGKVYDEMMSISEMESYLKKNKHIKQQIHSVNIVGGIQGITHKNDGGFKDVLSKIADAHPRSPLAKEHRKRSIKEVKTEQVIKKHVAKRLSKNK